MPLNDAPPPAPITDIFGIRSRTVILALAHLGFVYVVVTIGAGLEMRGVWPWTGVTIAFLILSALAVAVVRAPGEKYPLPTGIAVVAVMLVATALSWWSIPTETLDIVQCQPPLIAAAAILVLLALRGRPVVAWAGTLLMSLSAGIWSDSRDRGFLSGIFFTTWIYPTMILATLFVVMLRPMATRIRVLREEAVQRAVDDAAAQAESEENDRQVAHLDRTARPILRLVADDHEFTDTEVTRARLVEADLRDGLRAQGWHSPRVRDAVWRARERGLAVTLLDDRVEGDTGVVHPDLEDALIGILDEATAGQVTARVVPPGRATLATILVEGGGVTRRYDYAGDGKLTVAEQVG
ncbi:hypothetical protein V1Y59_13310 [Gordonia sp. PKS22-38]|uniref:Uncharacterized protein n=1 Tax=Gordonia prachuapensis TaxID=3115651 RepID=A0ABU7MUQ1_9ACTN|nr:hypothetical protein [Gordonia sp. PKS22-38]